MDKFKKYLQDNRKRFDTDKFPIDEGWEVIRKSLRGQKEKTGLFYLGIAASFLIVVSAAIYAIYQDKPVNNGIVKVPVKEQPIFRAEVKDSVIMEKPSDTRAPIAVNNPVARNKKRNTDKRVAAKVLRPLSEAELMDMNFQSVINAQLRLIRTTPFYAENPDYFSYFKKEYDILEKDEATLKMEAGNKGMGEEYLGKLIDIYQGKLSLLKRLQTEIQKMNNRIRQSDPGVSKRKPVYLNI
jgi:hypothetical protein